MRRAAGVLLLLFGVGTARADDEAAPAAMPPQARLGGQAVSKPRVRLGEPFQVAIAVRVSTSVVVDLPATLDTEPFEVVGRREAEPVYEEAGMVRREWELDVVAWKVGELTFPSVPVKYFVAGEERHVAIEPLAVLVEATIPEGPAPPPADAAPPVDVMQFDPRFVIAAAGVLGVVLLGVATWLFVGASRRRGRLLPAPVPIDPRTAEEIALDKLRELGASDLIDRDDRRLFYFAMTEIVREYLGRRFGFDALEQTTSELLAALRAGGADAALLGDVTTWTSSCDLVKYAGVKARRDEAERELGAAVALVERARERPAAVSEEVARAG